MVGILCLRLRFEQCEVKMMMIKNSKPQFMTSKFKKIQEKVKKFLVHYGFAFKIKKKGKNLIVA